MIVIRPLCFLLFCVASFSLLAMCMKHATTPRLVVEKCADSKWNGVYFDTTNAGTKASGDKSTASTKSVRVYSLVDFHVDSSVSARLYGAEYPRDLGRRVYKDEKAGLFYVFSDSHKLFLGSGAGSDSSVPRVDGCELKEEALLPFFKTPIRFHIPSSFILRYPVTSFFVMVLGVIWFFVWNYKMDATLLASRFESVVLRGETWRILSSSFTHESILHIAMNVNSLISLAFIEFRLGSIPFF